VTSICESTIVIDGVSLAVRRAGRGAPVVCLSAVGHDSSDFEALASRIGDAHEVISIDWPGHGRSGNDHEPASAERYTGLLTDLLDRLDIARPILLGNSIGGAVAMRYAAVRPVRGLVLCDPAGLIEVTPQVARICGYFTRFFAAGERGAFWFGWAYGLYYRMVLPQPAAAAQRRRIVAAGRRIAPVLRQAWQSFGRPDADIRALAETLDVPIWVAWATHDKVIPLARCRPAICRLKNATLSEFAGGHSAFLEQPDAFAEGFMAFSARLTQPVAAGP
jgi:4,5:9,10-diseco-3-hydroxy-5,9,17-trioxoandrosta-1(10),2-diene-4-oate hydrolase